MRCVCAMPLIQACSVRTHCVDLCIVDMSCSKGWCITGEGRGGGVRMGTYSSKVYFPDCKSHLLHESSHMKMKYVELSVRHAIAYTVCTNSHMQASPHVVKGLFRNETMSVRIAGCDLKSSATYNRGNTIALCMTFDAGGGFPTTKQAFTHNN